jgi:aminodeoxyfutalosine deaminase
LHIRKLQPQRIFNGRHLLEEGHVLLVDNTGTIVDILPAHAAGDNIEILNGWITPGFINSHCHLELSHMLGVIPEKTGLIGFVKQVMQQRTIAPEKQQQAIHEADQQLWQQGIQAVGDICNQTTTLSTKSNSSITYHSFLELTGWDPAMAESRYQTALAWQQAFASVSLRHSLSPHAPYSVSNNLWQKLQPHFKHQPVTLHCEESADEQLLFKNGSGNWPLFYQSMGIDNPHFQPTGKSSLQSVLPYMQEAATLLLVHDTFTQPADMQWAQSVSTALYWCICIRANQYIENALPPIAALRQNGARIVVGTDSLASNYSLSILDELYTIQQHFPEVPTEELLTWATSNGAAALQLHDSVGSLQPGTHPGILLLSNLSKQGQLLPTTQVQRLW